MSPAEPSPLEQVLAALRVAPERVVPSGRSGLEDFVYRTTVLPPSGAPVPAAAPPELQELWRLCGGIELHRDVNYGQSGCIVHMPAAAAAEKAGMLRFDWPVEAAHVLATFKGEVLFAMLTPEGVRIFDPIDHGEWPLVATTIAEFLWRVLQSPDQHFWEKKQGRPAAA